MRGAGSSLAEVGGEIVEKGEAKVLARVSVLRAVCGGGIFGGSSGMGSGSPSKKRAIAI